jgi:LPXTG-site transpeptidase (sortase) family protein
MQAWKKIVIMLAATVAVFLVLNINYFAANLRLMFRRPQINYQIEHQAAFATMTPNTLIIPSLGIQAPIIYTDDKTENGFQAALINGVVHYPGTANVGELGNVYIFGHSSDFFWSKGKYKNIFATLPEIKPGAEIYASNPAGEKFTYLVTAGFAVASNDTSVLDQQGNTKKLLTLQTSWPVGTALKRWVVTAELKNSSR